MFLIALLYTFNTWRKQKGSEVLSKLSEILFFEIKEFFDISKKIINQFENFLVDTFIIVHPRDICLSMPKFTRDYNSFTANLTCYSTNDYKKLLKTKRNLDFKITIKKNFPHHTLTRLFLQLTTKNSYMFKKIIKLISFFKRN